MMKDGLLMLAEHICYGEMALSWKAGEVRHYFEKRAGKAQAERFLFADALRLFYPGKDLVALLRLYDNAGLGTAEMGAAMIAAARRYYEHKLREPEVPTQAVPMGMRDFSDMEEDKDA